MAKLLLDTGEIFEGKSIGYEGTSFGEICFNTSMTGYQEILTDPSYAEQIVVMTYPEIGNYGINKDDFEYKKIRTNGIIIKNYCEKESHYKSSSKLSDYLISNKVVGISNIDTRRLTNIIRNNGAMNCVITSGEVTEDIRQELRTFGVSKNISEIVSRSQIDIMEKKSNKLRVGVIDTGVKKSILDILHNNGCNLVIFPANTTSDEILKFKLDSVLISNGPGNPEDATNTIETVTELVGKIPLYGICLGYQILSIVLGAKTYKLKYGHRGGNHPVINLETNKVYMTSQNHGYAVDTTSLATGLIPTYKNLNDETLEGFRCPTLEIQGVQFHPESAPGPDDAVGILLGWIEEMKDRKNLRGLRGFFKRLRGDDKCQKITI